MEAASAWVLAFADEGDPTFCVAEWIEAGWRDPCVVDAAVRICGTRADAEACMVALDCDLAMAYEYGIVHALALVMDEEAEEAGPAS